MVEHDGDDGNEVKNDGRMDAEEGEFASDCHSMLCKCPRSLVVLW